MGKMALLGCLFLASLLSALPGVRAEDARIAPASEVTEWELNSLMHVQLTTPETEALRITYSVYPLTEPAGLNRSDRSSIWIRGSLVPAEVLADTNLGNEETIVFFNCDGENATVLVNQVMGDNPLAILLYSEDGASCSLEGDDLIYNSIYTMGDPNEARDTMNNSIQAGGALRATITGGENMTRTEPENPGQRGSNSAVAMSILYSITGLITLLFLVIIGTGAIRAHRYPERYGPLTALGGRPSQSRVKGLARAVLETLPIVKFGDPGPAKPDPSLELESQPSATAPDPTMGTRLSAIPEEPRTPQARRSAAPMSGALPQPEAEETDPSKTGDADKAGSKPAGLPGQDHLGCSICTEDFTVGEDVRVLPCNHQFHPPCIDPWLVNISGTCPLCRLDLHPQSRQAHNPTSSVPPSPTTATTTTTTTTGHRRRSLRFLDLHRLRHASSIEERIAILRRHRGSTTAPPGPAPEPAITTTPGETYHTAIMRNQGGRIRLSTVEVVRDATDSGAGMGTAGESTGTGAVGEGAATETAAAPASASTSASTSGTERGAETAAEVAAETETETATGTGAGERVGERTDERTGSGTN